MAHELTYNGKRYSAARMELIAERGCYDYGNNYCGTNQLWRAKDGQMFAATTSNGQDCYRTDSIWPQTEADSIDNYDMTAEQEARAAELGLIEII
jgi:hypothetical protein